MEKKIKKKLSGLDSQPDFDELDHRLACGWHTQIEGSGQRKRYLKSLKQDAIS